MSELHTEHDRVASLIYLALSERRYDDAVELAEANWAVLISHNVAVLRAVADRLSPEELATRPSWDRIRRYLSYTMLDPAMRPATFIEPAMPATPAVPAQPRKLADVLLMLTTRSIAARSNGRFTEAVQLAREAMGRLDEARPQEQEAVQHRMPDAYHHWGMSFEFAGLEPESLSAYERAYSLGLQFGNARVAADSAGELAWLHALAGRGRVADGWIARAQAVASTSRSSKLWQRGDVIASALRAADQLRPDAAIELLGTRSGGGVDEHRLIALCQSVVFRLSAGLASPVVLMSELRRAEVEDAILLAEPGANSIVLGYVEAVVAIYSNRPDRAIELLDGVAAARGAAYALGLRAATQLAIGEKDDAERDAETAIAQYGQWPRQWIPALLVKAILALEAGEAEVAASAFTDACELALDNGLIASLFVIPHADFVALLELAGERAGERLADPRLTELVRTPLLFAPKRRAAVGLSPRELEVLRELAKGGALAEVAGRLHLSLNTLKVHDQSIYRKLGARGREAAIRVALDRGLI